MTVLLCALFLWVDKWTDAIGKGELRIASPARDLAYHTALLLACLFLGNYGDTMFIYFQF